MTTSLVAEVLTGFGHRVDLEHDGEGKLAMVLADRPDLVLCCVSLPRMSGFDLLRSLAEARSQNAALPLILLTDRRARASGPARHSPVAGHTVSGPSDFEMLGVVVESRVRRDDRRASASSPIRLTCREKDVLTWVGRGKTSAEIAIILGVSERTVNFHCERAVKRLDGVNRTQAVVKAIAHGLIGL